MIDSIKFHGCKYGTVVQLVRTPACQAGGREFEPRRSRIFLAPQSRGFFASMSTFNQLWIGTLKPEIL